MQNWKFAMSSIMSHKLRSFLTMVGIIIGVASVVVIMALGDGMKAGVTKKMLKILMVKYKKHHQLFKNPGSRS